MEQLPRAKYNTFDIMCANLNELEEFNCCNDSTARSADYVHLFTGVVNRV